MQALRLSLLFAVLNQIAPVSGPLRVLRVHPAEPPAPWTDVTVTFDRPVAGSLEGTIAADRIFRIEPAVPGRIEWRDPTTLRLRPAGPLVPGATYTVTIAPDFSAMDGSRLEAPYQFSFTVQPSTVITGEPVNARATAGNLPPLPTFRILMSSPTNPMQFAANTFIQLGSQCGGQRVPMTLVRMRPLQNTDRGELRYAGMRSSAGDTLQDLRRIIELTPQSPLPLNCSGTVNLPEKIAPGSPYLRWSFSTYGPLRVVNAECAQSPFCPTGPIRVSFSTPVRGSEVVRHVKIAPAMTYVVRDTTAESDTWILDTRLAPRQSYVVMVDPQLTDVFGQQLGLQPVRAVRATSYEPGVVHGTGKVLIERLAFRTLPVQAVNVDTLEVVSIAVPDTAEARFIAREWNLEEPFQSLLPLATRTKVPIKANLDAPYLAGVQFPANDARTRRGTLIATRIGRPGFLQRKDDFSGVALIQVTDLGVHGRIGIDQGMVWVTGVRDGRPRPGATVTLYDGAGKVRATARTDAQGLARLSNFRPADERGCQEWCGSIEGYVAAQLNDDRALIGLSSYDPDLSPWRFGISGAWGDQERLPAAVAVFTERGIYRPGERVFAKAIVRRGPLGALAAPPRGDSIKWVFTDREQGVLEDTITTLSAFGTADQSFNLPAELPLGAYRVQVSVKHDGEWKPMGNAGYTVAEYRPPEFLVDVNVDQTPRIAGDTVVANVAARYLFGAPMAGAALRWVVQQRALLPWDLEIPNLEDWYVGEYAGDGESEYDYGDRVNVEQEGVDTLDARGTLDLKVTLPAPANGRGARTSIVAVVSDANRQTVAAARTVLVHPAAFYIAARTPGTEWFWSAGKPLTLELLTVRPTGERVSGVSVEGEVIRREWHRVRRTRGGEVEEVGSWVSDTVANCRAVTRAEPVTCTFTPRAGGHYIVALRAKDPRGRDARTSFSRWAAGADWVPWRDETQLKMDLIADQARYAVGDTATVLIASPFTDVEAWVTIERERVLESRRMRIAAGATTIKVPITEALAPNAFVSVLVVRGRSAPPGTRDDPGRPTLRVGYTELRVVPAVKKLEVAIAPDKMEYRPGDTAHVRVAVKNAAGVGQRAEVTLWAVDEGVLALTGYRTPDLIDLLYQPRGLGVRLASNLVAVAAQIPPGPKGQREAGGGGGADLSAILRSRFQTTAFFIGSLVTDASGNAVASARLPDNLTTFRVMAVAVTAGDRYGSAASSMLVSRPLLARPSLPRFVRDGDRFIAGVVVNQRMSGSQRVQVEATARGITLEGERQKTETLSGAAGREVRFGFRAQPGDSAHFQFAVRGGNEADAVALRIPIKPSYHPLAQTIAGTLRDTATAVFSFDTEVDPARSTLEISFGSSTFGLIRGARAALRVYPYYCTEQVSSTALPLIALYRAQRELGVNTGLDRYAEDDIRIAIRTIVRRQGADGGIGYWSANDWSTPWLTAYAGRVLLEARAAGFAVDSTVLARIAGFMTLRLQQRSRPAIPVSYWYDHQGMWLAERVAAVDLLSRLGRADIPTENSLLADAAQMRWEDRVLLAEVLARRGSLAAARNLLAAAWQTVRLEGRRAMLPAASFTMDHYFRSDVRPAARLLTATLRIEPAHPSIGALVEAMVSQQRARGGYIANTQDYGMSALALLEYERVRTQNQTGSLQIRGARGTVLSRNLAGSVARDTTIPLTGLVSGSGRQTVRLNLSAASNGAPVYYFLTVREVPVARPVNPVQNGIQVERWYERVDTRAPIVSITEGELVRVRLRITVPEQRHMVVLDDPLPAGLEAVDLSLRTMSAVGALPEAEEGPDDPRESSDTNWYFGSWDSGVWSVFDHKELRDDRVVYFATLLWKGTYTATYLARATTAGTFNFPPAHAEEMYNPAVNGRTGGGVFTVRTR